MLADLSSHQSQTTNPTTHSLSYIYIKAQRLETWSKTRLFFFLGLSAAFQIQSI